MSDVCLICKVAEEFGALSNMSAHPVEFRGLVWPRAEHLFQALRFPGDEAIQEAIRRLTNPMAAKMLAKKHLAAATIAPRSPADLDNMRAVLVLKHAQHEQVRTVLTRTRGRPIVEDCTARPSASGLFWGARLIGSEWTGENWLGRLWMEHRNRID